MNTNEAYEVAGNWRSSHGFPLQVLGATLNRRARKVDDKSLYAQRLKRMPSIIAKLTRFENMQLDTMQDLGGCRAVVKDIAAVDRLVEYYEKHPCRSATLIRKYDYIESPKPDGYRSVHLVFRYNGSGLQSAYSRCQIEVQIRSKLQHAWSTAVETIDAFTNQALKSGLGDERWKRFFALMGMAIAFRENRPPVPNTLPEDEYQPLHEIKMLCRELKVIDVLTGLAVGIQKTETAPSGVKTFILMLDTRNKKIGITGHNDATMAAIKYLELERRPLPGVQSVLVSVDSIKQLRRAYPSYFVDTEEFLIVVHGMLHLEKTIRRREAKRKNMQNS